MQLEENAGQQQENIASVMDAVAAVVSKLTYEALSTSQVGKKKNTGADSYGIGREAKGGHNRDGVGSPQVIAYFNKTERDADEPPLVRTRGVGACYRVAARHRGLGEGPGRNRALADCPSPPAPFQAPAQPATTH
jgi:hypothetical protein